MQMLEVIFGDNDFGWPVERALRRLWAFMHENNQHLTERPMAELFLFAHQHERLAKWLNRLVDIEYLASGVEFCTRGISTRLDKGDTATSYPFDDLPEELESITTRYLSLELVFHDGNAFTKDWKNGEHAYLNLSSGDVATF